MEESRRIRMVTNEDYGFDIEYGKGIIVVHIAYLKKFHKGTFNSMAYDLERFSHFFKATGYDKLHSVTETDNVKLKRLLKKFNFVRIGIAGDLDIFEREN